MLEKLFKILRLFSSILVSLSFWWLSPAPPSEGKFSFRKYIKSKKWHHSNDRLFYRNPPKPSTRQKSHPKTLSFRRDLGNKSEFSRGGAGWGLGSDFIIYKILACRPIRIDLQTCSGDCNRLFIHFDIRDNLRCTLYTWDHFRCTL